jgi:signal transduction histidine kinase
VAQHAEAEKVQVALRRDGREVVARVADDGRGFDGRPSGSGVGLTGMRERAMIAGGTLDIVSAPGHGTVVELRIGGGS